MATLEYLDPTKKDETPYRTFVCVSEPNTRFQVLEGSPDDNKPFITFDGPIYPTTRTGDLFVEFSNGVFATRNPLLIKWCEDHYPMVLDIDNAETSVLVSMAKLQVHRHNYEPEQTSVDLVATTGESIRRAVQEQVNRALIERGIDPDSEI